MSKSTSILVLLSCFAFLIGRGNLIAQAPVGISPVEGTAYDQAKENWVREHPEAYQKMLNTASELEPENQSRTVAPGAFEGARMQDAEKEAWILKNPKVLNPQHPSGMGTPPPATGDFAPEHKARPADHNKAAKKRRHNNNASRH